MVKSILLPSLRDAKRAFFEKPWLIILVQFPEVSIEWLRAYLEKDFERSPWVVGAYFVPYFWIASVVTSAATFAICWQLRTDGKATLKSLVNLLKEKSKPLAGATALSTLLILVGLPVFIPGLYFMSCYFFVVPLVLLSPSKPAEFYLSRSKSLSKPYRLKLMLLSVLFILFGLSGELFTERLFAVFATSNIVVNEFLVVGLQTFLSVATGVTINLTASYLFIHTPGGVES